jgi:hypothetical protein
MSKTPEELAEEWVNITFNESDLLDDEKTEPTALEAYKTISKHAYLAGCRAAQDKYEAEIRELKEELKGYYAKTEAF